MIHLPTPKYSKNEKILAVHEIAIKFSAGYVSLPSRLAGHYFCQFEKRLPQPEIKCTRRIYLEIRFNLA